MFHIFKKYLLSLIDTGYKANGEAILNFLDINPKASLLDLGCNDGSWTVELAKKVKTKDVWGLDIVDDQLRSAKKRGINTIKGDLNNIFDIKDARFDVVHANQVIEHLYDTDNFISEIHRILKPGGYAILSTENLASWHNIFALLLGFQPFSMSNFSRKGNIGNPLSLWNRNTMENVPSTSWLHNRLFTYFGLNDLVKRHGFHVEKIVTSGYYPFPGNLAVLDRIHGHWMTIKIIKK